MVKNLTGFAGARQRALIGVPDALATGGDLRRGHLSDAKHASTGPYGTLSMQLLACRRRLNLRPCI
jgi:hypothetical protein